MSPHNDIMALTEAGEDARGFGMKLFSGARVCTCVRLCVCVTVPGLTESSWALVNESQSIKDKNKT